MCKSKYFWGRRGTMIIGALITMAFFFAYTQVKSNAENNGFSCAISFCLVSPSSHLLFPLLHVAYIAQAAMQALLHSRSWTVYRSIGLFR